MINERYANKYCRDDIANIENYDKAVADPTQTWELHHRDEVKTLPSGIKVYRSVEELIENGRYFNCPANELIFLTPTEHKRLHMKGKVQSDETRKKMSDVNKGKILSYETRKKMSEAKKGKTISNETRKKISRAMKGKRWKMVDGKRIYIC